MCVNGRRGRSGKKDRFSEWRRRLTDSVSGGSVENKADGHRLCLLQQPLCQVADGQSCVNGGEARETLQPLFVSKPALLLWRRYICSQTKTEEIHAGGGDSGRGARGGAVWWGSGRATWREWGAGGGQSLRHKGGGAVKGRFMERLLSCSIYNACSFTSPLWQG